MQVGTKETELRSLECALITPLRDLYLNTQSIDVRAGSLKILLHVLEVTCFTDGNDSTFRFLYGLAIIVL